MGCCCGCCCRDYDKCCCGCFSIQTGAKIILILSLIFEIILLINDVTTDVNISDRLSTHFFNNPRRFDSGREINPVLVASIIISLIWIALDVFAIIGISLKKPGFMVGWLIVHMIALVLFTIASFIMAFMTLFFTGALIEFFTCSPGKYGNGCIRDTAVAPYDTAVVVIVGCLFIGMLVGMNWLGYYFWDIVRSAKAELEQEEGRARAFELGDTNSQKMLYPTQPAPQQIIIQVPPTQQGFVQPPQYTA